MPKAVYSLAKNSEFVITNYDVAPPFSSFFPGIAGLYGCPMWTFYTNRGQAITSAGVQDKNGALIEFQPANKAYRLTSLQGFRTFIKTAGRYWEPFSERSDGQKEMRISPDSLVISDENKQLKLRVIVTYFTVPNEPFPALARLVELVNLSPKSRQIEIIDGLPIIIPFGFDNDLLKKMSQTIEAWCQVENLDQGAPFYRLKVLPADAAETKFIDKGNFFLPISDQGRVSVIVDPNLIFGSSTSLEEPLSFIDHKHFTPPAKQLTAGFTPCAFAHKNLHLPSRGKSELALLFGQMDSLALFNQTKKSLANFPYLTRKAAENKTLITDICSAVKTASASPAFDRYTGQTFLDNVMRGGLPKTLDKKAVYVYYRKHGDMERDYNDFRLMPTYFSQGNGNYRDINQNRRNDLFFNPEIGDNNISRFFNLLQLDGFNPLVVLGSQYYIRSASTAEALVKKHIKSPSPDLAASLTKPFLLGALLKALATTQQCFLHSREEFIEDLLTECEVEEGALHGEGFWTDHFSYNTDLLESFGGIFPEKLTELLFDKKVFTFFDNDHIVVNRQEKYHLVNEVVRQFGSVRVDPEKAALIKGRQAKPNLVRTFFGQGEVYYTTLAAKIISLLANKVASFDAAGIGLEMEAEKPNWYDALNGLPGLLGSSLSETLELKRLAKYLLQHLDSTVEVALPIEVNDFIKGLNQALASFLTSPNSFLYWDKTSRLKEDYRWLTRLGLKGEEITVGTEAISSFLNLIIKKCDWGIKQVLLKYRNYYTYFINEVTDFEVINNEIKVKAFRQKPLPLFLEGFVHALKVEHDKKVYQRVKTSPLFDKTLKMYKVNASLANEPLEIGRAKIFTPGWLENESIWLHMEYKYLLELLKVGLYKEFFTDFQNVLVPFLDPKQYKRSILENSSFLVSSAHPDKTKHGQGFIARLSGGAAEFIDIWITMMAGKNLFYLDDKGKLCFKLTPILPTWLFKGGQLSFKLLGTVDVTYLNPKRQDTFGKEKVKPLVYRLIFDDLEEIEIHDGFVKEPYASIIRERKVKKIVVTLG